MENIRIASWQTEGLRCPDHTFDFTNGKDSVHPVSLIQMPNGTGKTTTLELLRVCLSGEATDGDKWNSQKVISYKKRNVDISSGFFKITLLHNNRRITIVMNFDFEEGIVSYTTTLPSGMKKGFHLPRELRRFFRPDFVSLFVFDGELAERLLDRNHTNAQSAIEDLFQLKVFTYLITHVKDYWEQATKGKTATEQQGYNKRQKTVTFLRGRITKLKQEYADTQKDYNDIKRQLIQKKNKFQKDIEQREVYKERLHQADQAFQAAEHRVQMSLQTVFSSFQDPHALSAIFANDIKEFKENLDKVKLPESAAREFFEELAEEDICVCGRELDNESRLKIKERAKLYLGNDEVALLNSIKKDISDYIGSDDLTEYEKDLDEKIKKLNADIQNSDELRTERDAIEAEAIHGDPNLEKAKKEIDDLAEDLQFAENKVQSYEDPTESAGNKDTFGIKILETRLERAERKLAEITKTIDLKNKTDVLIKILQTSLNNARSGLSDQVCADANSRMDTLMPNNNIRIDKIHQSLRLKGGQEKGSKGETLSVAYAFLSTLFNRSDHQLPFIVDSPAGPIDFRVRNRVAELIPKLAKQFIAFVISSERPQFVEPLKEATDSQIQYITMFHKGRNGLEEVEAQARKQSNIIETTDGIVVLDDDFFNNFDLEKED